MPFPSAGCQTCKNRRVKCDEALPVCQRCVKAQRVCHGMRAGQAGYVLHIENSYASGQKKRPRGPRSTQTAELTSSVNPVLQRPLVDLKSQAVGYYMHHHFQTVKDVLSISKGISDVFLPIWMSRAECLMLDLAVSSMALAVFSRTQRHPPAAAEASMTYHRLLQLAQVTIPFLHKGNIDVCLLAVFFMSRYEDIVHHPSHLNRETPFTVKVQSFSHHDGALAMLKVWKDRLSDSHPATDVIKHTRRGVIRSALMRHLALPEWMVEGAFFGEHGLELEYDCIVVQIASVRQRLARLLKEVTSLGRKAQEITSTAETLNHEARDLDKALQDWTGHFPDSWWQKRHNLPDDLSWPTRDFYSPIVYSYLSPAYAAAWSQYYTTRMLLNSTRLRILELSHPDLDDVAHEQRLECLSHMKTMTNDLASSLPFCLERFKVADCPDTSPHGGLMTLNTSEDIKPYMAAVTVWPLTIASSLREVDFEQRAWFRSELARLGRALGIGILECADDDLWLQL